MPASTKKIISLQPAPIEALRIKGYLSDLPVDLLTNLVSLNALFLQINDRLELHRRSAVALISSGAPDRWGNWGGIAEQVKELRRKAMLKVDACLQGIETYVRQCR